MDDKSTGGGSGAAWTIPALVLGLAIISLCLIVPQTDANRRLDYERQKLLSDLDQINRQTAINEQFLGRLDNDPALGERLAQRQMRFIRQGESVLPISGQPTVQTSQAEVSPYSLVALPPPPPPPAYIPPGGQAGQWILDDHLRLYCLAAGLFLTAAGLVLSSNDGRNPGTGA